MAPSTPSMQQAAAAVLEVVSANRLEVQSLTPIGGYANMMFKLEPLPIVARVAGSANAVRTGDGWLFREVQLAEYLNRGGANVVRPWWGFSPGPYEQQGCYLTFWEHIAISSEPVSPTQLGNSLCHLHKALDGYSGALPVMGALEEAWAILDRPELSSCIDADNRAVIARKSEKTRNSLSGWKMRFVPLHGDAHHGNLWQTERGLIWGDFEDTHLGPAEWDLACMTASSTVFGRGKAAEAALDAYAESHDTSLLNLLVEARTLQAIAWAAMTIPDVASNKRFRKRMEWLAHDV